MTTFEVRVTRYGDSFVIGVPAFGVSRFVDEMDQLDAHARNLIAGCGAAPAEFDIEIEWMPARSVNPLRVVE
ncbi:hypothetical protein [Nocardia sp. NPDC003345]